MNREIQKFSSRSFLNKCLAVLATGSALIPSVQLAQGASASWNKTAVGTFQWNDNANWSATFPNGSGDVATVTTNLTGAETINLNTNIVVNGLTLGDSAAPLFNFTIAPNGGSLTFDGASPFLTFQNGTANQITAPVTLAATSTAFTGNSGALTISGGIAYNNAAAGTLVLNGATGTISNAITQTGAGALSLVTNGAWTLSAANSYTGTTTVNANTLTVGVHNAIHSSSSVAVKGGTLSLGAFNDTVAGVQLVAGAISGSTGVLTSSSSYDVRSGVISANLAGGVAFNKSGDGTVVLSGANTFTGAAAIAGGTLYLDYTTNNSSKLADGAALTLGNGAQVYLTGGSHPEVVASTALNAGASSVTRTGSAATLQMGAITRNTAGTLNFSAAGIATTDTTNTNGILGGYATVAGAGWATNSTNAAGGPITALATYTNDAWAIGNNTTVTTGSAPAGGSTTNSLRFNNAAPTTVTLAGINTISSGGILVTPGVGNNLSQITGGTLQGATGTDLVVHQNNTANALTINAVIADNGSATGLTKGGPGTLNLGGANSFTGNTFVSGGTLGLNYATNNNRKLGGSGSSLTLSGSTAISMNGNAAAFTETVATTILNPGLATIVRTGGTGTKLALGDVTTNRAIGSALNIGTAAITTTTSTNTNGIIGGWATIGNADWAAVDGGGNITTLVGAGGAYETSLVSWVGGALPAANVSLDAPTGAGVAATLTSNATINSLRFTRGNNGTGSTLNLAGNTLTISSGGILVPNGGNTNGPPETITGGTILTGALKDFVINVSQTKAASGLILSSVLADNGSPTSLTKTGANSLQIGGANTYTGTTFVTQGYLIVGINGGAGTLGPGSVVLMPGGALATYTGNAGTKLIPIDISGGGSLITSMTLNAAFLGGNTTILTGNNSYSGGTTIGGALANNVLQIGNGGTTGTAGTGGINLNGGNRTLIFNRSNTYQVDNQIVGVSTSAVRQSGTGTLILGNTASTFNAPVAITSGTLSVTTLNSVTGGVSSSTLGTPTTVTNGTIAIGSGASPAQFTVTGTGETTDRVINLAGTTGGATLDQSGTGLLTFTSNFTATGAGSKTLTLQGSTIGVGEIAGAIVDNSGVNKTSVAKAGTGTWVLSGVNSYTGATSVTNGTLRVNGSTNPGSAFDVGGTGTLGGSGVVGGTAAINSGGTLSPGNSPGSLQIGGSLTLQSGSSLDIELGGVVFTLNGTEEYDRVKVLGAATLGGTLNVSLVNLFTLGANQFFGIVDIGGGPSGAFAGLAEGATVLTNGSYNLLITYLGNVTDSTVSQTGGTDVVLYTEYVPEPASFVLLSLGGLFIGARRRSAR